MLSLNTIASSSLLKLNCSNPDCNNDDDDDGAAAADDADDDDADDDDDDEEDDSPIGLANITVRTSFSPPISPFTITSSEGEEPLGDEVGVMTVCPLTTTTMSRGRMSGDKKDSCEESGCWWGERILTGV